MRLEKASYKATVYACKMFHYAKSVPVNTTGFSVFNDCNEWCGVVLFGPGASPYIGRMFGLPQGSVVELVRVSLNGKQENVSSVVSKCIKLIKKQIPLCKLIISYADLDQKHIGVIYQAMNFYYLGVPVSGSQRYFIINGKKTHPKSLGGMGKEQSLKGAKQIDFNAKEIKSNGKHKYIYVLDKTLIPMCKELSKPYPKKENTCDRSVMVARHTSSMQEGFDSTLSLN